MKIISKYKDYYDYLSGIRGIDNKIVLDRRVGYVIKEKELRSTSCFTIKQKIYSNYYVCICDMIYPALYDNRGGFYWGEQIKECGEESVNYHGEKVVSYFDGDKYYDIEYIPRKTDLNIKYNCPILNNVRTHYGKDEDAQKFPMLKHIGIASYYPAEKIHTDLYNWIIKSNTPTIIDNRTDIEKIDCAGFDKVHSFRNTK